MGHSQQGLRPRLRPLVALVVVLGLGAGPCATPVEAATLQWQQQLMPRLAGGRLEGVSCPSPVACVAVGTRQLTTGRYNSQALVESWDGKTWQLDPAPTLATTTSSLGSVSCVSATSCVAVGVTGNLPVPTTTLHPFAEVLMGSRWEIVATAKLPAGTYAALSSISCSQAKSCVAVGNYLAAPGKTLTTQPALAEAYNGSTWVVEKVPVIAGHSSYLSSISCSPGAEPTSCTAVGSESAGNSSGALAYHAVGNHWQVLSIPGLPSSGPGLTSVSCPLPTSCVAIGSAKGGPFSAVDDANKWSTTPMAKLPTPYAALAGISCAGQYPALRGSGLFLRWAKRFGDTGRGMGRAPLGCPGVAQCLHARPLRGLLLIIYTGRRGRLHGSRGPRVAIPPGSARSHRRRRLMGTAEQLSPKEGSRAVRLPFVSKAVGAVSSAFRCQLWPQPAGWK